MTAPASLTLTCPLCGYDLRGLPEPRCPECGFRFIWAELENQQRNRHRYLFEHAERAGRWLPTFWRTYWRTCRPRRFWREVSPASPVRARRLVAYWLIGAAGLIAMPVGQLLGVAAAGTIDAPTWGLKSTYFSRDWRSLCEYAWDGSIGRLGADWYLNLWAVAALILAWPWLTTAVLLVFQGSMRRAKVDRRHVLRAAVYGCDFNLLLGIVGGLASGWFGERSSWGDDWLDLRPIRGVIPVTLFMLACAAVATYRIGFAYARYLRFDRPWLTVLSSQVILVLMLGTLAAVWMAI